MVLGSRIRIVAAAAATGLALVGVLSAARVLDGGYFLLQAGANQARLLAGRIPLDEAAALPGLSEAEREALAWVPRIRAFGREEVGLSATDNYTDLNPDFDQPIWNVSGCAPDRFEAHGYRYPIVGKLPYIGYFSRADALREAEELQALGWETHVRPAGAYSTLGWFRDPLWRSMLAWDTHRLANTVLHELAHATLWLPGEGAFNESWASFVGDQASARFLDGLRETTPAVWARKEALDRDRRQFRRVHQDLSKRLSGLYRAGLPRDEVLRQKELLLAQARTTYRGLSWSDDGYADALNDDRPLNNASLVQFQVYNTGTDIFAETLELFGGDLPAFVAASRQLAEAQERGDSSWDPFNALGELPTVREGGLSDR